ncbi:MAG: guanylate kinase, partial [Clostridium sp.]
DDEDLGLTPLVTYTTRPIRSGEVNGCEYFFTDLETLNKYREDSKVIECRVYATVNGDWHYATVDDGQLDKDINYILITTLDSYTSLKNYFSSDRVIPFYVEVEDGVRLERALSRERTQLSPNYSELCRRFLADSQDFSEERLNSCGIVKRYINNDLNSCIKAIKEDILRLL